jgi:hypothetical protein
VELRDEGRPIVRVCKTLGIERPDVMNVRVGKKTEDGFQMRIGGGSGAANFTDVDAGVKVFEKILKDYLPFFAGNGVGVLV